MFKFLKIALPIALLFVFAACTPQEQQLMQYQYQYRVVLAPDSMYNCPVVTRWPKIKTLTDLQVARLIVQLAENNKICKSSLDSIKAYYARAKREIEAQQPTQRYQYRY